MPVPQYLNFIRLCAESGITSVQLREKNADYEFKFQFALQLKKLLAPFDIPLIINDDIDLAIAIDAEGVHLGQTDGSVTTARKKLGNKKIIGLSIEADQELDIANTLPVNYVAASAVFPSIHKHNLKKIWGLDGLINLSSRSTHPIIAIGGIDQTNLDQVLKSGAHGAALIGALHEAENPAYMATRLREIIDHRS